MILSDKDIKKAVEQEKIVIKPKPDWKKQLGSCSLDLRLAKLGKNVVAGLALQKDRGTASGATTITHGEFVLAVTKEYLELPADICGLLHGRSSLGRKGLMIHSTAPLIDAGFRGRIVLELYNAGPAPIALKPGMKICAVSFERLTSSACVPYYKKKGAKFLGQLRPS